MQSSIPDCGLVGAVRCEIAASDITPTAAAASGHNELDVSRRIRIGTADMSLLTYIRYNRGAIINYGKRYRAGFRIATTLAESAVNSLVGKRMVKKQQMRWSLHGAHLLMQVRTAALNGELRIA